MINKKALLMVFCILIINSCTVSQGMKNTNYVFEPKEFHSLELDQDSSLGEYVALSGQPTELAPEMPKSAVEIVLINAPLKVVIDTKDIDNIVWDEAKVPLCIGYIFANDKYQKMSDHYVFLKDINTGEMISTFIDLDRFDHVSGRKRRPIAANMMTGGTIVYNITYFTDLPKYSAEYEVWVKIADLESNHVRIKIDLKERGKLLIRKDENG